MDDDGPADYADNQEAVDLEPDGTTIKVEPGAYGGFALIGRDDLKIEGKNKDADIRNNQYGWVNIDSDGIVCDRCHLKENTYGIYTDAAGTEIPATALNHCRIEKNTDFDVVQGPEPNTLVLHKTRYDTYDNLGGGMLIEE